MGSVTEILFQTDKLTFTRSRPLTAAEQDHYDRSAKEQDVYSAAQNERHRQERLACRQCPHFGTVEAGLIENNDQQHWNEITFDAWAPTREAMVALQDAYKAKHADTFHYFHPICESDLGGFISTGKRAWQS